MSLHQKVRELSARKRRYITGGGPSAIQKQIASSVDIVVQHAIGQDGVRRVTHITEVAGVQDDQVQLRHLFEYKLAGFTADGQAIGSFVNGETRPKFYDRLRLIAGPQVDAFFTPPAIPPPPKSVR